MAVITIVAKTAQAVTRVIFVLIDWVRAVFRAKVINPNSFSNTTAFRKVKYLRRQICVYHITNVK